MGPKKKNILNSCICLHLGCLNNDLQRLIINDLDEQTLDEKNHLPPVAVFGHNCPRSKRTTIKLLDESASDIELSTMPAAALTLQEVHSCQWMILLLFRV